MSSLVSKNLRKALNHVRQGELKDAEAIYKQVLSQFPKNRKAIQGYQKLKAGINKKNSSNSEPPDNQLQELLKLFNANRWEDVLQKARPLGVLFPNSTSLCNLKGASYAALKKYDAAINSYDQAIKSDPFYADAHLNKGSVLQESGELDAAIESFKQTLFINPQHPSAFFNMGNALMAKGELDLAVESYKNALRIEPKNAETYFNMGNAFRERGELEEALESYRMALKIRPNHTDVHLNMGNAFEKKNELNAAMESYNEALKIKPNFAEVHNSIGIIYEKKGEHSSSIRSFQQAVKFNPKYAEAYFNLGKACENKREIKLAINYFEQAIKVQPDYAIAISDLIYLINLSSHLDGQERFSQSRAHVRGLEAPFALKQHQFDNLRDPDKNLNIGFVSADFRNHPIATHCLQLFSRLSKHPKLVLHAYHNNEVEDNITNEIKKYFSKWSIVTSVSDQVLAERIIVDEIDILIDLSNHTAGNRLSVFARKPAPLQVTALGLPYTTALKAVDYYFTSPNKLRNKIHFSECLLEMPSTTAYNPLVDPPDVNGLPALKNGFITFGSCNKVSRISRSCISLWAKIFREVPNSRFVFAGQTDEFFQNKFEQWLIEENVDLSRIDFLPRKKTGDYLKIYNQIDVHLMLNPLAGSTTIADALFMGVPSLGLYNSKDEVAGEQLLSPLGLEDFFLKNEQDLIFKGLSLAQELETLTDMRKNLRKEFTGLLFCNPDIAAAGWETALRTIWKRWCSGLDPEAKQLTMKDLKYSLFELS